MSKIGSFKKRNITVLSVSLLLGFLFASWYIVKHPTVEIVNIPIKQPSAYTGKMSTPELSETLAKLSKPEIKEVTKSIEFLEMFEKQRGSGNQSNSKTGTADTGSELSQEEIYQLIRL